MIGGMDMKTPEQLREDFWRADIANGGWIRTQYDEIKTVLESRDMHWTQEQYRAIKLHSRPGEMEGS